MENEKDSEELKNPEMIIDEIVENLDSIHSELTESTQEIGYSRETFRNMRPFWQDLQRLAPQHPDAEVLLSRGGSFLKIYREEIGDLRQRLDPPMRAVRSAALSAHTFVTTVNFTASLMTDTEVISFITLPPNPPKFLEPSAKESYADRFSKLDAAVGDTYCEICEALYGTRSDPERAALFLIRQAFDQLFAKLAPDVEVRASEFWQPKKGGNPEQVWREERIKYAAHRHVKDKARARTLVESSNQMLQTYQELNRAHERGRLDQDKARKALMAMESILKEWAEALEF